MEKPQLEMTILKKAMVEAATQGVPFIGDVYQRRWDRPYIAMWHYDYLTDLSPAEVALAGRILATVAKKEGASIKSLWGTLSFEVLPEDLAAPV